MERIYPCVVDYISRTYRYLENAVEYERAVPDDATTRAYIIQLQQKMSKLAGSATQRAGSPGIAPSTRILEIEVIAAQAGLRYEDVPDLALKLEGTVRQGEKIRLAISELFLRYSMQQPWGRLLVGLWPEKLTLGLAWIFRGCVFNAGTGRCWPVVDYTVRLSLVGPMCALLHMAFLELER